MVRAIFLDRDGVINQDPRGGYVSKVEDFKFIQGSLEAIKKLNNHDYEIFVISNQAGISKGIYTIEDLEKVNEKMLLELEKAGCKISDVKYCIHKEEDNCSCRKPKTGLIAQACKGLDIDYKNCFFVGDKITDVQAGKRLGCKTILVLSGKSSRDEVSSWVEQPDYIMETLKDAVDWVIGNQSP